MLFMVEKGTGGGVSTISNRYGKANNKYMSDRFDASKPSIYIMYLDANNLYGWVMSKPLPTHSFKWMKPNELENWEIHSCILEVDLEYPKSLHDCCNDYPLGPERIKVNKRAMMALDRSPESFSPQMKFYIFILLVPTSDHQGGPVLIPRGIM